MEGSWFFFAAKSDGYIFNGPLVPLFFKPKNYFVLIYDFSYKYFKNGGIRERIKNFWIDIISRIALKRAKKIISLSEATKMEIIKFFGFEHKITTIYPGFNDICALHRETTIKDIGFPYFFYVSTLKKRKNVSGLIEAFIIFKRRFSSESRKLVIVGKFSQNSLYKKQLDEIIQKAGLQGDIIFLGHISDENISYLYRHATALVYPSFIEGFGFPILEAMSCGAPVITSNTSSMAEIAGGAALLIPPDDTGDIADAMAQICFDERLRASLVEKGKQRAELFSWDKSSKEYCDLFKTSIYVKKNV